MPSIKSLFSNYYNWLVTTILSFSKVILFYSYYTEKKLVYIIIAAPFSRQPSSYIKCTQANIRSSCNVWSVFNTKYIFLSRFINL